VKATRRYTSTFAVEKGPNLKKKSLFDEINKSRNGGEIFLTPLDILTMISNGPLSQGCIFYIIPGYSFEKIFPFYSVYFTN